MRLRFPDVRQKADHPSKNCLIKEPLFCSFYELTFKPLCRHTVPGAVSWVFTIFADSICRAGSEIFDLYITAVYLEFNHFNVVLILFFRCSNLNPVGPLFGKNNFCILSGKNQRGGLLVWSCHCPR